MYIIYLHSSKLTWNLKNHPTWRKIIFQSSILGFHINFPGCIPTSTVTFSALLYSRLKKKCWPIQRGCEKIEWLQNLDINPFPKGMIFSSPYILNLMNMGKFKTLFTMNRGGEAKNYKACRLAGFLDDVCRYLVDVLHSSTQNILLDKLLNWR